MIRDFHMHPQVMTKPELVQAFIQKAISLGICEICITDHMPLSVSRAADRIPAGQVGTYCARVNALARQYQDRIIIRTGIEVDYHPAFEDEIQAVLSAGTFDYILGSTHLHASEPDIFNRIHERNAYAEAVLENTLRAVQTGWFSTVSHLDMYRWIFDNPQRFPLSEGAYDLSKHLPMIERILNEIRKQGMFLELNPHFAEKKNDVEETYPQAILAEMALQKGIRFAYGSDAHQPEDVGCYLEQLRAHPVYGKALQTWASAEF